jgi:hypothetical protein
MLQHKSPKRARQFRRVLAIGLLVAGATAAICGFTILSNAQAQLLAPREPSKRPTSFGSQLWSEMPDIRLHCLSENDLDDKSRRGVVSFCTVAHFEGEGCSEYPVVNYPTVGDILQKTHLLKRKSWKPQIRVIQKDAIFQSSLDDTNTVSGFSPEFLQRKINAGDIIVVSLRYD